jgi:alkylated DNA repair dioxygenase AlkB
MAVSVAEAVIGLWELDKGDGRCEPVTSHNEDGMVQLTSTTTEICNVRHTITSQDCVPRQCGRPERPFSPDAAIVNYYREVHSLGACTDIRLCFDTSFLYVQTFCSVLC